MTTAIGMASEEAGDCEVSGCDRPAGSGRGSRCAMHAQRRLRGIPDHAPAREQLPLRERVLQSAIDLVNADSEDDAAYEAAWERLRKSLERWSRSLFAANGGKARFGKMTAAERTELGKRAARSRWGKS